MTEYYKKYLKYKTKYLNLVNMKGGVMPAIYIELKDDGDVSKASKKLDLLGEPIGLQFHGKLSGTTRNPRPNTNEVGYHNEASPQLGIEARDYLLAQVKSFIDITPDKDKTGGPFVLQIEYNDLINAVVELTEIPSTEAYTNKELEQMKELMLKLIKRGLSNKEIMNILAKRRYIE